MHLYFCTFFQFLQKALWFFPEDFSTILSFFYLNPDSCLELATLLNTQRVKICWFKLPNVRYPIAQPAYYAHNAASGINAKNQFLAFLQHFSDVSQTSRQAKLLDTVAKVCRIAEACSRFRFFYETELVSLASGNYNIE